VPSDDTALPLRRTTARISVGLRAGLLAVAVAFVPLTVTPPVSWAWLGPALALFALWTAVYGRVALRRGIVSWLVVVDVAGTAAACLFIGQLVPVHLIQSGTSWVGVLATVAVVATGVAWPAWASVPTGLAVAAAYVAGSRIAGAPDGGIPHGVTVAIQVVGVTVVMVLVRRARRAADAAFIHAHDAERAASIERAHRLDERQQLALLHDTALATLTMVASAAIDVSSTRLRDRAARDLGVLRDLAGEVEAPQPGALRGPAGGVEAPDPVRLDERLARVVADAVGLDTTLLTEPSVVPAPVAEAIAGSVAEALTNVVRHAGVDQATVRLTVTAGRVVVTVVDEGVGFDPASVPAHRYGLRRSIAARMAGAGGSARVDSAPGSGTTWTLEWSSEQHH
jgi:signal transduction histidine kinase